MVFKYKNYPEQLLIVLNNRGDVLFKNYVQITNSAPTKLRAAVNLLIFKSISLLLSLVT